AITALQIHRRCAKPPNRRIESDLYSELDRGARRRKPGAHADQPAPAPAGRPARHRARGGLSRLRRFRPRLHRHGGGAVVGFARRGSAPERPAKAATEKMQTPGYYHLYRPRSNEPAIALAETLLEIAPVPMARVVFQCSGSEANDTAVKLAWYYWNAVGEPQR